MLSIVIIGGRVFFLDSLYEKDTMANKSIIEFDLEWTLDSLFL